MALMTAGVGAARPVPARLYLTVRQKKSVRIPATDRIVSPGVVLPPVG
jgi:hypothetical protein